MTATDIDAVARIAYEAGVDPADYAEAEITSLINAHFVAALRAVAEPGPHPDYSTPAMARRILGALLNAGWQMPVWPIPEPEAEEEPEPMPVGAARVVPRLVIDRDELGFACLEADCPECCATALIVNEWDAAECLSCSWREFEPPQEAL